MFDAFPNGTPALSFAGFPAGSLPLPAKVAVTCNGVGVGVPRKRLGGTTGVISVVGGTTQLQTAGLLGNSVEDAVAKVEEVFAEAYPRLRGGGALAAATSCQLWVNPAWLSYKSVDAALAQLADSFAAAGAPRLPALTVTIAALRLDSYFSLQCFGSAVN